MVDNNLSISAGVGEPALRRKYGLVRAELGPRVALALKQAGVFDLPLDAARRDA